ncbi:hypothetical protein KIN20_025145 [Parelaphostrongylus tenuis]|uniref:Uncharacterized protein n=1 Tax=Parelaphostrongylus tenuis TaxID=148309 RepID=A0AAD5QU77_PARTN|nr:hypothetical protein KIN20_025145 [Parelaphostrongylus tenuis]
MSSQSNGPSISSEEGHLLAPFHYITSMPGKQDNSVLRRGLPVTHHIYGTPRTINAANYVYFIALEKCAQLSDKAVTIFAEQMLELHRGQGKELYWRDTVTCPTEVEYEEMIVQTFVPRRELNLHFIHAEVALNHCVSKASALLSWFDADMCLPEHHQSSNTYDFFPLVKANGAILSDKG